MIKHTCETCCAEFIKKANTHGRFCSLKCVGIWHGKQKSEKAKAAYAENPKRCVKCNTVLAWSQRKENIYCSSSCSAITNNNIRAKGRKKSDKRLITKIPKDTKAILYPYTKVYRHLCIVTGIYFYSRSAYAKYSSGAAMQQRLVYRQQCNFRFSPYAYPDMAGYDLLLEHGVYHPVTNPMGVSRDHLLSVADGWANKIDPEIMRHRANCRLILHSQNQNKYTSSAISIADLQELINGATAGNLTQIDRVCNPSQ
jgi:hypothetical protein